MKTNVMYIVKKKPVLVDAVEVLDEVVVETKEGPRTAHVGDYILTGVAGESWPIEREKFIKTYLVIDSNEGGLVAQSISGNRCAMRTEEEMKFVIREETFTASAGDIIIRYGDGDYAPSKPDIFDKTYDVSHEAKLDEMIENAELYDLLSGEKYGL